eukprot:gnl/Chilomastix_caulleri/4524.p1 GENE.gnl/Chilomastix_caulleri/4524~~gnl/Chilomastix_caulleri/4524.p1  ORF type:complete len:147 (+),score=62.10 gnl/Chilomastix_caulleri/4524:323-763(+)
MSHNIIIRPAEIADFSRGHLKALAQLTSVGDVTEEMYASFIGSLSDKHIVLVAIDETDNIVVGSASLIIEPKLIHGCASAGHIEDVVVLDCCRGTGLGKKIIGQLVAIASQKGCYKVLLDCAPHNVQFYAKCGLEEHGMMMSKYLM